MSEPGTEELNEQKSEKSIWSFKNNKVPRNGSLNPDEIKSMTDEINTTLQQNNMQK